MASLPVAVETQEAQRPANDTGTVVGVEAPARLTALEWSVVAMGEKDSLASLRQPGRILSALASVFGLRSVNRLANDRLEALRRVSVLAWRYRWNVPKSEVRAFLEAGFTHDHYELVQNSIGQARAARSRKSPR